MLIKRLSRSVLCKRFQDDILNFCIFNPFRLSKAVFNLYFKYYSYKSLNFNFHKKFKVFYKKSITMFGRNKIKTYFLKLKFLKKKLMLFFGFNSLKQLSFLFNNVYFNKSVFMFSFLLNFLELRLDFLAFRLRLVFSIFDARSYIFTYGFLVNNVLINNFLFQIKLGDYIEFVSNNKVSMYLKYYRFWFNEFIYSNKFFNFFFFFKIVILKIITKQQKKLKNLRYLFFYKNPFFLTYNKLKNNLIKKDVDFYKILLNKIKYLILITLNKSFDLSLSTLRINIKKLNILFLKIFNFFIVKSKKDLLLEKYYIYLKFNEISYNEYFFIDLITKILKNKTFIIMQEFFKKSILFYFNILILRNFLNINSLKFLSINDILKNKTSLSRTLTTLNEKILSKHIVFLDFLNKFFQRPYQWMYLHRYSALPVIKRYLLSIFNYYKLNSLIFLKNIQMQFISLYNYIPSKTYYFDYPKILRSSRLNFSNWARFFFLTVNKYNKFEVLNKYSKLSLFSDIYKQLKYRFRHSILKEKKNLKTNILLKRFNLFLYLIDKEANFKQTYFNNLFILQLKKLFFIPLIKNSYFLNNEILDGFGLFSNKFLLKENLFESIFYKYKVFYNKYIYYYKKSDFYNFFLKSPKLEVQNYESSLNNLYLNFDFFKKSISHLKRFYRFKLINFLGKKLQVFHFKNVYYKFYLDVEKLKIFQDFFSSLKEIILSDEEILLNNEIKNEEKDEEDSNLIDSKFFSELEEHIKLNRLKLKNKRKYNNYNYVDRDNQFLKNKEEDSFMDYYDNNYDFNFDDNNK